MPDVIYAQASPRSIGGVSMFDATTPITEDQVSTYTSEEALIRARAAGDPTNGTSMRQRTPPDPDHLHPVAPWTPDRLTSVAPVAASFTHGVAPPTPVPDWYVVVDELDELGCRLAVDAWPDTDGDGRLVFADGEQLVSVAPDRLHAAISAARLRRGDEAPERPLRIGDTFAWWSGPLARDLLGLGPPDGGADRPEEPGLEVVDITRDARRLTKVAALATGGGVLAADELARLGLAGADGDTGGGAP